MREKCPRLAGIAVLELLLALAFLALLFQVFPQLWARVVWMLDVRNWSRGVWMALNAGIVLVLFGIRFGPGLYDDWRQWTKRLPRKRSHDDKQLTIEQERELYERMQEARKRQVV